MKRLYLIRHGKSSWDFDVSDELRTLTDRGITDSQLIGKELKSKIKSVDLIISSHATRAYETAKLVVEQLEIDLSSLQVDPDLYDFNGNMVMQVIKNCSDSVDSLLIFGHNHAFTTLANKLGNKLIDNLPTTGVVAIDFKVKSWDKIEKGKTVFTLFPKSLR